MIELELFSRNDDNKTTIDLSQRLSTIFLRLFEFAKMHTVTRNSILILRAINTVFFHGFLVIYPVILAEAVAENVGFIALNCVEGQVIRN